MLKSIKENTGERYGWIHRFIRHHSTAGHDTIKWLENAVTPGLTTGAKTLREALHVMGATVQYDAAKELGRQMGIDLRLEAFNANNNVRVVWTSARRRMAP